MQAWTGTPGEGQLETESKGECGRRRLQKEPPEVRPAGSGEDQAPGPAASQLGKQQLPSPGAGGWSQDGPGLPVGPGPNLAPVHRSGEGRQGPFPSGWPAPPRSQSQQLPGSWGWRASPPDLAGSADFEAPTMGDPGPLLPPCSGLWVSGGSQATGAHAPPQLCLNPGRRGSPAIPAGDDGKSCPHTLWLRWPSVALSALEGV